MVKRRIDPKRLARAIGLDVERLGGGKYLVSGGAGNHLVDLEREYCDCVDHSVRQGLCKHILVCRLHEGDAETVKGLREVVR